MHFLAHLVSTGAGPFYDGAAHFLITFEEILPVVSLAFYAGLNGKRASRLTAALLPAAWFIGGITGLYLLKVPQPFSWILMLFAGVLLASDRKFRESIVAFIMILSGLALGNFNGSAMADAGTGVMAVTGAVFSAAVVSVLGSALAVTLASGWTRIALRVAGSWLAAIALLALGWSLRK